MRHRKLRRKLGVNSEHRKALLRNLVKSLVARKRIRTTLARAKEASAFADQMVTLAKRGDLHARRLIIAKLGCKDSAKTLIDVVAPHFKDRQGGYTRVLRMPARPGDNSDMALLEFTAMVEVQQQVAPVKKKVAAAKSSDEDTDKADAPADGENKSGFLGSLRKFLKGEES